MMPQQYNETLEILVEERSMEHFLKAILPSILPETYRLGRNCDIRTHEGKQHLRRSIKRKVRAYQNYPMPVRLLIIHDQDKRDCKELKKEITCIVRKENPKIPLLIRIPCRELENWYLGDLAAIEKLYPASKATRLVNKSRYRDPDTLHGATEMKRLSDQFGKTDCAKRISQYMNPDNNKSTSFKHFVTGIRKFCR